MSNKNINSLMEYFLVGSLLLTSNTVYQYSDFFNSFNIVLNIVILISLLYMIVNTSISKQVLYKTMIVISIFIFVVSLIKISNREKLLSITNVYYYLYYPIMFLVLVILYYRKSIVRILEKYVRISVILSIISLFFWSLGSILKIVHPSNVITSYWADGVIDNYYYLHFDTQQIEAFGNVIIRNSGIYPEPPMFNLSLCIALLFQILILKRINLSTWILIVTIITTTSTTGVFVLGFLVIYMFIIKVKGLLKYISILCTTIIMFLLMELWDNKSISGSASIRFDDYNAGLITWKENLFLGSGFTNGLTNIQRNMDTTIRDNLGYSNSLFVISAQGGILLIMFYFFPILYIFIKRKYSYDLKFFLCMIITLMATTIFVDTYIFLFIIGMIYATIIVGEVKNEETIRDIV
ncbi:MAG: hypothetical protein E6Y02_00085 [Gemella haemolysans]|uniref:O-antigen ligase family protein n=1 Tax=Gemella haemolysans TaxID=1379 RepID=UPI002914A48B|nr:O-antigen ligase family protein [Gemella haemolysans]MDU4713371.1 hypothetical protein [Gemella haemolysans]